ncbi:A/G-specific adenine glycosylase [Kerstersia sp.]|uniref:A/G-specific adenine glycosylase n=1 Tax=Kerstersia sp. TaxID=1930783 RepID=UPI003F913012
MDIAPRIIEWQARAGRHGLPWQQTRDPYRVWLSEIMLQQTQVSTVLGYYARFLSRFPDIAALAAASQEEVMPYWAGLGYYARARNLHRCAQTIAADWQGEFPRDPADIETLSGIGRSTAAAIAAFSWDRRAAILDGNVKRVFTRYFGIEGDPSKREIEKRLWDLADAALPGTGEYDAGMPAYTQGLMDLGATVCTRGMPACTRCPLAQGCSALATERQLELPTPKARKAIPEKTTAMLVIQAAGQVLLQQRPQKGIWGGLWSLPEFSHAQAPVHALQALCGAVPASFSTLAPFAHVFTHYRLLAQPCLAELAAPCPPPADCRWFDTRTLDQVALPRPVEKLLLGLYGDTPSLLPA